MEVVARHPQSPLLGPRNKRRLTANLWMQNLLVNRYPALHLQYVFCFRWHETATLLCISFDLSWRKIALRAVAKCAVILESAKK